MCYAQIIAALAPAAGATGAAGAALSSVGGLAGTAGGAALSGAASTQIATALSSASFLMSTTGQLLSFAEQAKMASAMGEAAVYKHKKLQMQASERERQEKISTMIENDQLARNAALGMAKTRTLATGQGLAGDDDRITDFVMNAEEMAGLQRANLKMTMASLTETVDQSAMATKSAVDQARSATSPLAYAGLAMNIGSGYLDSYRMFGSLPFEDPAAYAYRVHGIAPAPLRSSGRVLPSTHPLM